MSNATPKEPSLPAHRSTAHQKSLSFTSIDPTYSSSELSPSSSILYSSPSTTISPCWLYGEAELECYTLHKLRQDVKDAKLNVWYPGTFHTSSSHAQFSCEVPTDKLKEKEKMIEIRTVGRISASYNGNIIYEEESRKEVHTISLPIKNKDAKDNNINPPPEKREKQGSLLVITINTEQEGTPPTLFIERGSFATSDDNKWQWRSIEKNDENKEGNNDWSTPMFYPKTKYGLTPPHEVQTPSVKLTACMIFPCPENNESDGDIIDFGREIIGHVFFSCEGNGKDTPTLYVGESIPEVMAKDETQFEQSTEIVQVTSDNDNESNDEHGEKKKKPQQIWKSKHPLALRYVRIVPPKTTVTNNNSNNDQIQNISCHALFQPIQYNGAFFAFDPLLTKIWMYSAYTLRLSLYSNFIIDGLKRDRLPWMGDVALSIMVNAYTFADAESIRFTLVALTRAGIDGKEKDDVNGIVDYSLWWIISEDLYQLYFGDMQHLLRSWKRIRMAMNVLIQQCHDESGMLLLDIVDSKEKKKWIFIDWAMEKDVNKITSLQILWWWALKSGAALADRVEEYSSARLWRDRADKLERVLYVKAWDNNAGAWLSHPNDDGGGGGAKPEISRHANLLAIISGLTKCNADNVSGVDGIKSVLLGDDIPPVGTPYMKAFECMALSYLGETTECVNQISSYWGGMLDQGATTYWEAYNHNGEKDADDDIKYSFYNRPFGKSLCHAWGSGPAMLLPSALMGIRPTVDGWKRFTVSCCDLGDATKASAYCACVPTPREMIDRSCIKNTKHTEKKINCDLRTATETT